MEGATRSHRRAVGSGASCSPEVIADPQVEANGYIGEVLVDGKAQYRLPAVPVSSTNNRRLSIERPSSENTLRKCSKSSATAGTRLPDSKTPLLPEAWPMQRNRRGALPDRLPDCRMSSYYDSSLANR